MLYLSINLRLTPQTNPMKYLNYLRPAIIGAIIIFSLFGVGQTGLAGPNVNLYTSNVAGKSGFDTNVTNTTLSETIGQIIRVVLTMTASLFLALTVYAGILWMTAGGSEEKVGKATKILYMSIIGLIIVFAAYGITTFVLWAVMQGVQESNCPWGPGTC